MMKKNGVPRSGENLYLHRQDRGYSRGALSVDFKGRLHSKLALNFLAGLKVFLENFYNENDLDWCRRYLDILCRNMLKDAEV